jgi:hypothetical protein
MSWKRRLFELSLAGGAMSCFQGCWQHCCNANPDPCCYDSTTQQCADWNDCLDAGGDETWVESGDAGLVRACVLADGGQHDGG